MTAQVGTSLTTGVRHNFLQREARLRPGLGQTGGKKPGRSWDRQSDLQMLGAGSPLARWVERRELGVCTRAQGDLQDHPLCLLGLGGLGSVVTGRDVGDAA